MYGILVDGAVTLCATLYNLNSRRQTLRVFFCTFISTIVDQEVSTAHCHSWSLNLKFCIETLLSLGATSYLGGGGLNTRRSCPACQTSWELSWPPTVHSLLLLLSHRRKRIINGSTIKTTRRVASTPLSQRISHPQL